MVLHEVGIFLIAMFSGYYMVLVGLWDLNVHIVFFCFWDGGGEVLSRWFFIRLSVWFLFDFKAHYICKGVFLLYMLRPEGLSNFAFLIFLLYLCCFFSVYHWVSRILQDHCILMLTVNEFFLLFKTTIKVGSYN